MLSLKRFFHLIVSLVFLTGVCGWLATHQRVWLPACSVCLPEDDLCGPLPGLPERGGVRCHLLWSSELCETGTDYLSVWSSLIWLLLRRLTVSVIQRVAFIVHNYRSICIVTPFNYTMLWNVHSLGYSHVYVFHTDTHSHCLLSHAHNYSPENTHYLDLHRPSLTSNIIRLQSTKTFNEDTERLQDLF